MALRHVPWAIGNGAENSVELARAGIYSATSGATGITEPGDFIVKALPTPGAAVRVYKGGGVIKSTYPGVFGQSYAVQEESSTDVPVAATGSSGGATKYVYVLIKDTQYSGQNPPSVENGPYNEYAVTTTLPANQPYLLLAKIVQPASTATITGAMITDMRTVANPKFEDAWRTRTLAQVDAETLTASGEVGEYFPNNGGPQSLDVPDFATRALVEVEWIMIRQGAGNAWGQVWFEYGPYKAPSQRERKSREVQWDTPAANNVSRAIFKVTDDVYIPVAYRGTSQLFVPKARRAGGVTNSIQMDAMTAMNMRVRFLQVADPSTS